MTLHALFGEVRPLPRSHHDAGPCDLVATAGGTDVD